MKKIFSLLLATVMILSLCACGGKNETVYKLGDTVSTDMVEFTLDDAQLSIVLSNIGSSMGEPKTYDAEIDDKNPYVAATGHTLVFSEFKIKNIHDRPIELDKFSDFRKGLIEVEYNKNTYEEQVHFLADVSKVEGEDDKIFPISSTSSTRLNPDSERIIRAYLDIAADIENLNDVFYISFSLPDSSGEEKTFKYEINAN